MVKMFSKTLNRLVDIYGFDVEHSTALIFDPMQASQATRTHNGWATVPVKTLIPQEYALDGQYCSKSERNRLISRLSLLDAWWQTTDGCDFPDLEEAIVHQQEIEKRLATNPASPVQPDEFEWPEM